MIITQTDLRSSLSGITYPTSKASLLERAADNGASTDVLTTLGEVVDGLYFGFADVLQELEVSAFGYDDLEEEDDDEE